jgi:hypothetical protein
MWVRCDRWIFREQILGTARFPGAQTAQHLSTSVLELSLGITRIAILG